MRPGLRPNGILALIIQKWIVMRDTLHAFRRFILATGLSVSANLGGTAFLHEVVGLSEEVAFGIMVVLVFFLNFFMMRHYVCCSSDGSLQRQFLFFLLSSLTFRGLEYLSFLLLHSVIGIQYLIAITGILGISFFCKFFFYRSFVFVN